MKTLIQNQELYVKLSTSTVTEPVQTLVNLGEVGTNIVSGIRNNITDDQLNTLVTSPDGITTFRKHIKHIDIINRDTISHEIELGVLENGADEYRIWKGVLESEFSFRYVDGRLFILDSNGIEIDNNGGDGSRFGFIDYNDTTGPINIIANTWTTIPNDGAGAFTNKLYKPLGVTELMDVSTGAIDPRELNLGDAILIRNDYQINPTTNNSLLEFRYTLGADDGAYVLEKTVGRLDDGSGREYRQSVSTDLIYMGDTNTRNNLIQLQVKLSGNGVLTNAGSVISVLKY